MRPSTAFFGQQGFNPMAIADGGALAGTLVVSLPSRHACKLGFEGIVSKRLGSICRSGRSQQTWMRRR
jgi:hypothetical protein